MAQTSVRPSSVPSHPASSRSLLSPKHVQLSCASFLRTTAKEPCTCAISMLMLTSIYVSTQLLCLFWHHRLSNFPPCSGLTNTRYQHPRLRQPTLRSPLSGASHPLCIHSCVYADDHLRRRARTSSVFLICLKQGSSFACSLFHARADDLLQTLQDDVDTRLDLCDSLPLRHPRRLWRTRRTSV